MSIPNPGSLSSGSTLGGSALSSSSMSSSGLATLSNPQEHRARLTEEFSHAVDEAQSLLHRAASEGGERAREMRSEVESRLRTARERLNQLQEQASDRARDAARGADHFVHAHPWQAMGLAAASGLVIGLLMHRR
jgi:ElaB/YqjD/DUF883 family membrane-anchored ribosome-binding protein